MSVIGKQFLYRRRGVVMGMVKIKRIDGQRLKPRDSVDYFRDNPELWEDLKFSKVIEIPEEVFPTLVAVEIVKEEAPIKKPKKGDAE